MNPFSPSSKRRLAQNLFPLFARQGGTSVSKSSSAKQLRYEALEPRLALAAAGLVAVGAQPQGDLSGKIVYLSPGHGYQYKGSSWTTDRGESNEIVEPFGTQDQSTYLADYLFQAGATVVPMRPIGHQLNEVVLDNDSAGVTFSGAWSDGRISIL